MRVLIVLVLLVVLPSLGSCARKTQLVSEEPPSARSGSYLLEMDPRTAQATTLANGESESPVSESPGAEANSPPVQAKTQDNDLPETPRMANIRGATAKDDWNTSDTVNSDSEAKFEIVHAKAERVGIENLTQGDIKGLSAEQLKRLRGY